MNSGLTLEQSQRIAAALNRRVESAALLGKFDAVEPRYIDVYWTPAGPVQTCRLLDTEVQVVSVVECKSGSVCPEVTLRVGDKVAFLSPQVARYVAQALLLATDDAERAADLYAQAVAAEGGVA